MLSRGFQMILSVLIFICSTLAGMAQETIRKEARAEFFVASELRHSGQQPAIFADFEFEEETEILADRTFGETSNRSTQHTLDDFALPASISSAAQAENSFDSGKNKKRNHKRTTSIKSNHSKCRILKSLPEKSESRGVARNPQSQDARQERTAAIRFLHLSALAC